MLCGRLSLFTNSTRVPGETVICAALTPDDVMVMVVVAPGDGVDGEPPHAAADTSARAGSNRRTPGLSHPASRPATEP